MEKVKVSREVAEFIEGYEENVNGHAGWEDHLLIEHTRTWAEGFKGAKEEAMCMKDIRPLKLSEILIHGYEVEQSPEEKLRDKYVTVTQYNHEPNAATKARLESAFRFGIKAALNTLDIKVKGINA